MKILFVWPNKDAFGFKPIGISLLSGIARNLGWDVKLFDTTEIDFGFINVSQAGESAKIFKPVDFSRYGLQKRKLDLDAKITGLLKEFNPVRLKLIMKICEKKYLKGLIQKKILLELFLYLEMLA